MENNNLPEGTDGSELHTSTAIKDVEIEHNGKIWRFQFVELSWKEKMELASELQEQQTNMRAGVTVTTTKYWRYLTNAYNKTVKSAPQGFRFDKCSFEFGEKLINAMPGVGAIAAPDDIPSDTVKN